MTRVLEDTKKARGRRQLFLNFSFPSLQIGADNLDDIVGSFPGRLRIARHVIPDMVFHELAHQAVDGTTSGGEPLEDVGALFVFVEGAKNAFELADDFLGTRDEIEFFARSMRHFY
jgi:hypothetical protein